ncbi:monooxygenase [Purpureocillium lilacinum]|uniref:Monooxygenase n=1 Tax=Purpureocillium lilacinum TaxID=33203 RepID=A0A179EWJ5_PURLI|nr:monooxygenase [Purpureocillium lilacinum]OAQ57546.1 monooxygenase [Purpureocillium lilacinum]
MVFHCALNAMFALACHFSDLPPADREPTSDMFFQKTKTFVGIGLIEHNSLSVVQALLIVSLYLQSTAFPDRCWNSVGIACRLAQGLGLHIDDNDGKDGSLEAEVRRRTWYCCVILDMNVSMTFGRPPMTSTIPDVRSATSFLRFHDNDDFECSTEDDDVCFFVETFRLSQILEAILRTIYQPWRDKHQRDFRYVRILLDAGAVEQSWQQCQTILESISTTSLSVQKSLQLLRRLYDGMVTRSQATTLDIDNVPATSHPVDATTEASEMGMNSDRFTSMDDIFAETIDTDMIETLFNSLGSGIAFSDDIIS